MMSSPEIFQNDDPRGPSPPARIPRQQWELWCVAALLVYFLVRLLYFAVNIAPEIPPDESTHLGMIRLYAETPLLIDNSPESYRFGLVTRQPSLYYFLLGKLAAINFFGMNNVLYLRLINVVLAMLTVVVGYRIASRLTDDSLIRLVYLVVVTNTPMFTFIGAAVSYDNLVNLLATLAVYSFVCFVLEDESKDLLLLGLWVALGVLTKTTFLPLALLLALTLMVERRRRIIGDVIRAFSSETWRSPHLALLATLMAFSAVIGVSLYGGNVVRYGRLAPSCSQVIEHEQCMENRIYARNWVVNQYRDGVLTFEQALRETSRIAHPGDRDHAVRLLQNERSYRQVQPPLLPVWDYMLIVWHQAMKPTIFGIQAHQSMSRDPASLMPYSIVLFAALLLVARGLRWRGLERLWVYLTAVATGYYLFLVGWFNYTHYLSSHAPFLGVQGRYIFPVMIPGCLVIARFLMLPWRHLGRIIVAIVLAAIFLLGDFPYFLRHDGPNWYVTARSETTTPSNARPSH